MSVITQRQFKRHKHRVTVCTRVGNRTNLSKHPLFRIWRGLFNRCYDPFAEGYKHYGEKGVCVCSRWFKFKNFIADMGERPGPRMSIDRINPFGHYEPSNCRWANAKTQASNTRKRYSAQNPVLPS